MGIVNKRNAVLGWLTWKVGKGMAKKKAKDAIPHRGTSGGGRRKKPAALLAGVAATVGGVLFFWRKGKGHEGSGPE